MRNTPQEAAYPGWGYTGMWKTPGLAIWEHNQAHWYGLHVLICAGGGSAARIPACGYVGFPRGAVTRRGPLQARCRLGGARQKSY